MKRRRSRSRGRPPRAGAQQHRYTWLQPPKATPPEPFFYAGPSLATNCPETELLCAVLEDAFECFYDASDPEVAADAKQWFFAESGGAEPLFSFLSVCEALALDPREIRRRLTRRTRAPLDAMLREKKRKVAPRRAAKPFGAGRPRPVTGK